VLGVLFLVVVLEGGSLFFFQNSFASEETTPLAVASSTPSSPGAGPSEAAPLGTGKKKALLSNFRSALGVEFRALEHRQRFELQELKAAQRAQKRDFQVREKEARKEAFKSATSGAEKRKWMEARESRWKALTALHVAELEKRKQEQKVRRDSLKHEQAERFKEFESFLSKGAMPPERLWPQGT
jgi:hypothetical protein